MHYLTPDDVATRLSVSPDTVREWARAGKIRAHKFGHLWRFLENELNAEGFKTLETSCFVVEREGLEPSTPAL